MNQKLFNRIVVVIFGGIIALAFLNPLSIDPLQQFHMKEKLMLQGEEVPNFIIFLSVTMLLYFTIVNAYHKINRKLILSLLGIVGTLAMVISVILL